MTTNNPPIAAWAPSTALQKLESRRNNAPCILTDSPAEFNDVALVLLSDYEALQAECEKLRKVVDQYRRLIELGEDFQWENIIRVDISDFPSRAAAIDAAMQEGRMDVVSQNQNTAEHYPADEWIPNNGQEPDLPYGTLVDVKFSDGDVEVGLSTNSWIWTQDGDSCDITHYRIHQPVAIQENNP